VPIGLYESVFDYGGPVKFLKGWRYVGFSPWGGGLPNGTDAQALANVQNGCPPCVAPGSVIQGPLYGIVFFNGAMTFRQIDEIANNMTCPTYVPPVPPQVAPQPEPPGVQTQPTAPGAPGVTTPSQTTPRLPSTSPPGPSSWNAPKPYSRPLDGGVRQTSSAGRPSATRGYAMTKAPATPKAVDPKKLQALEAEVFKSLDYAPTNSSSWATGSSIPVSTGAAGAAAAGATSTSPVPALTPAMPVR
jgi:hypothetical protein